MFKNLCNTFINFINYKIINMKKINKRKKNTLTSSVLIFCIFFGNLTAYAESLHQVRVVIDGKWNFYKTDNIKVDDFFKKENITINPKDIIDTDVNAVINEDTTIYIDKAEAIKFLIDGKEQIPFITNGKKVGIAIKEFNKETNRNVYLEEGQSSAASISNNMTIKVSSFKEKTKTIKENIPFSSKTIENPNLSEGVVNVKTKGENGIKEKTIKEIYKGDKLESSEIVEEKITKKPVEEVIEKGTKKNTIKTEKGIFVINKKINMRSTAYTAGPESTGKRPGDKGYGITASGMKAQRGVVAVDTKVIPFGTKLYIEGYGYAVAGDTGSAIKGNKIDVFLDRERDAINYGVRNVNVYVLGEKVA